MKPVQKAPFTLGEWVRPHVVPVAVTHWLDELFLNSALKLFEHRHDVPILVLLLQMAKYIPIAPKARHLILGLIYADRLDAAHDELVRKDDRLERCVAMAGGGIPDSIGILREFEDTQR